MPSGPAHQVGRYFVLLVRIERHFRETFEQSIGLRSALAGLHLVRRFDEQP